MLVFDIKYKSAQCDQKTGKVTENECPTPPPIFIDTSTLVSRVILYFLNFLGLHTFVAFFGGILIACGMVRLVCGGVLFCRKSKAQQHFDDMRKKHGGRKRKLANRSSFLPYYNLLLS